MTVWISDSLTEMADLIRKSKNSRGKYIISSTKAASGPCLARRWKLRRGSRF
jgi:hypothetical protein